MLALLVLAFKGFFIGFGKCYFLRCFLFLWISLSEDMVFAYTKHLRQFRKLC